MQVKVRDRKTGNERTVTQKAYAAMGPKVYEKLGMVNDDGSELVGQQSPNQNPAQVSRSVKGAAPVVVVRSQIASPEKPFPVNESKTEEAVKTEDVAPPVPEKTKAKPGPKPKVKSISSNPNPDEK